MLTNDEMRRVLLDKGKALVTAEVGAEVAARCTPNEAVLGTLVHYGRAVEAAVLARCATVCRGLSAQAGRNGGSLEGDSGNDCAEALMQDYCRGLSVALSNTPDARRQAREAAQAITETRGPQ